MKNNLILKQIVMKSFAILLMAMLTGSVLLADETGGQGLDEVRVSLKMENTRVKKVLEELHESTDFNFLYNEKDIRSLNRISIQVASGNLEDVLFEISKQTGLTFRRVDENIAVRLKEKRQEVIENVNTEIDKKITGKVTDAETGEPLVGATIQVKGTTIGTITDNDGKFSLFVPKDVTAVVISYIGYKKKEVELGLSMDLTISLEKDVSALDEAVILGVRKSFSDALNIKINSVNMIDAVVAEDIAKFPQSNVSEALQRVSGVQIRRDYAGGVGNEVSIRGLPPEYTNVSINGVTTTTNADNRTFNFNILPAKLFQKAEVIKTPTADMEEGGIAGTVHLETLKPLNVKNRILAANIEGQVSSLSNSITPRASLIYSNSWSNKFGLLIGASYDNFYRRTEAFDAVRWKKRTYDLNQDGVNEFEDVWFMDLPRYILQDQNVERLSINTSLQYRLTDNFTITYEGMFISFNQLENRYSPIWFFRSANGLTDMVVNDGIVEYADFDAVDFKSENQSQNNESGYLQNSISGKWFIQDWEISADGSFVSNNRDSERFRYYANVTDQASYDIRDDFRYWNLQTQVDIADPYEYTMSEARRYVWENTDKAYSTSLDVQRNFNNWLSAIKFGSKYRDRTKERSYFYNRIRNIDEPFAPVSKTIKSFLDHEETAAPGSFAVHDWDKAYDKYGKNIDIDGSERQNDYYNINEAIFAGYLLTKIDVNIGNMPLQANIGVRATNTQITSKGSELIKETGNYSEHSVNANYVDILPSISTRLKMLQKLHFRAGFVRVLTRPDLGELSAYRVIDDVNKTISAKNPELDPFRANQYDVSLEWYPTDETLISASYFYKDIESFITYESKTVDYNNDIYTLTRPVNGNAASINGVEVNFQKPFTFLPSPLDGLGTVLNYTYAKSTYEEELDNGEINSYGLPNHSKHSYNIIGYYDKYGVWLTLAHNFRSNFLREKPNPEDGLKYRDDYGQTDLSAGYKLTDNLGITFNVINVFNSKRYEYIFKEKMMDGYFNFGRTYQFGLRVKL